MTALVIEDWVTSLGPCTSICDASYSAPRPRGGCFTPWCECQCHGVAAAAKRDAKEQARREAAYVDPVLWEGDDT